MDKSQYQTPQTVYNTEAYSIIEQSAVQNTPEKIHAPFQFVKDLEDILDSCHETAEALEQKNGREIKFKYVPVTFIRAARSHEEILEEQLNAERIVSMDLFRDKGRFCAHYGGKIQTQYSTPEVGHWYIEEMVNGKPGTGPVTHIETHKDHVKKFDHQGRRVPMTISDIEVFAPLTYHYTSEVMDQLYPFDRDRADIILDGVDFPDNVAMLLPPEHHDYGYQMSDKRAA